MNVASLENCKRLYELSGWDPFHFYYFENNKNGTAGIVQWHVSGNDPDRVFVTHAYDLGYLLRKLPPLSHITQHPDGRWICHLSDEKALLGTKQMSMYKVDKSPEDAACLLAIKLFEEGILKKDNQ